jgi:hypothetical protein
MKFLTTSVLLTGLAFLAGCGALGQYAQGAGAMTSPTAAAGQPAAPGVPATSPASAAGAKQSSEALSETGAPKSIGVDLKNSCGQTAKVFFGDKPKFGSGTYSSLGSNVRSRHTFQVGDQFWIVDDSQNGVANVVVDEGTREIEIRGSCDQLAKN